MPTRKCDKAVQTGTDLVQKSHSETQTGSTLQLMTSATTSAVTHPGTSREKGVTIMPFCTTFELDNFGWYKEGRAIQTSPTWGKMAKLTQTPASRNTRKMTRARSANTRVKAQRRRSEEEPKCQGTTQPHTRTHSDKQTREVIAIKY